MTHKLIVPLAATALAAALALGGCSSSGGDAAGTTTTKAPGAASATTAAPDAPASRARFCSDLKAALADYQPHMDDIFANGNDNPTLAEWADFLPAQIDDLDAMIARVKAVDVPDDDPEITAPFGDAVGAFESMSTVFHDSLDAAKAGDATAFKAAEDKNQGEVTPKLQEATGKVGELCGFPQG